VEEQHLVNIKEIARLLGISVSNVYKMLERENPNAIPRYRIGVAWRFDPEEVLRWGKNHNRL